MSKNSLSLLLACITGTAVVHLGSRYLNSVVGQRSNNSRDRGDRSVSFQLDHTSALASNSLDLGDESTAISNLVNEKMEKSMSRPVFSSLSQAAFVLRLALETNEKYLSKEDPKIQAFYKALDQLERCHIPYFINSRNKKVVVVEGLSSTGKTTLINNLMMKDNSVQLASLPRVYLDAHDIFQDMHPVIVKAFEFVSLYFLAKVVNDAEATVVLIEKFYHSRFVFSLSSYFTVEEIKEEMNSKEPPINLYEWPTDLPKPSLVIYLALGTQTRLKRKKIGGGTSVDSRSDLRLVKRDKDLEYIFSIVRGVDVLKIDGDNAGSDQEVLKQALHCCQQAGIETLRSDMTLSPKRISLGVYGEYAMT
jgi:thymidylate kinase